MTKTIALLLTIGLLVSFTACTSQELTGSSSGTQAEASENPGGTTPGSTADNADLETDADNATGDKTLVVYYSATGNTEAVVGYIAGATDADTFALIPTQPYSSDDLNWRDQNSRVSREYANPDSRVVPLVASTVENWDEYDTVFIGYPIWWGIAAWPVGEFIADNDFTGKTVIPFCTSSSSGLGESDNLLAAAAGTGNWLPGERFRSSVSQDTVLNWLEGLDL